MRPSRIILVRHGQSEGNVDKSMYTHKPDWKLDLTPLGVEQAIAAGKAVHPLIRDGEQVKVYCSTFYRARQTCAHVMEAFKKTHNHVSVTEDPRLREQERANHYSEMEMAIIDKERDEYGTFYYRFPGGESCGDVYDRVSGFLETMFRDFTKDDFPQNVIIVAHGMLIRVFLMRILHWSPEFFHEVRNPHNGAHLVLEKEALGKHYQLVTPLVMRDRSKE